MGWCRISLPPVDYSKLSAEELEDRQMWERMNFEADQLDPLTRHNPVLDVLENKEDWSRG